MEGLRVWFGLSPLSRKRRLSPKQGVKDYSSQRLSSQNLRASHAMHMLK